MRCQVCPAPDDRPCLAETTGHRRFCTLAATDPHYRAFLAAGNAEPARPTVSEAVAAIRLRNSCPFRSRVACGCSPPKCLVPWLGDARGECPDATADECMANYPPNGVTRIG